MRRGDAVEILPYLFDLLSEKLTERMWKLSSWNVGRKRTEFGFTKQSVCQGEQLFARLAFCYLCIEVISFSFQDQACHCIFCLCEDLFAHCQTGLRQVCLAVRHSLLATRISGVNQGIIFFLCVSCFPFSIVGKTASAPLLLDRKLVLVCAYSVHMCVYVCAYTHLCLYVCIYICAHLYMCVC